MLNPVVIVLKSLSGIKWRIDVNTLDLPRKLLLQRLQRQQVVPENQPVVELVLVSHPLRRVVRETGVFQKDAGFQLGALVLADPGEFEFRLAHETPGRR